MSSTYKAVETLYLIFIHVISRFLVKISTQPSRRTSLLKLSEQAILSPPIGSDTALECKQIGKALTNTPQWRDEADKVMDEILCAKIDQLKEMKDLLSTSKPNTLFAHSVYDLYWGTGLDTEQTKHTDPVSWPGQNMFGKLIQRLADKHRGNRSTNKPRSVSLHRAAKTKQQGIYNFLR